MTENHPEILEILGDPGDPEIQQEILEILAGDLKTVPGCSVVYTASASDCLLLPAVTEVLEVLLYTRGTPLSDSSHSTSVPVEHLVVACVHTKVTKTHTQILYTVYNYKDITLGNYYGITDKLKYRISVLY